jgi:hypothetical protein
MNRVGRKICLNPQPRRPGRPLSDDRRDESATGRRLRGPLFAQLPDLPHGPEPGQYRHVDAEHRPGLADLRPDAQLDRRRHHHGAAVPADAAARPARGGTGGPGAEAAHPAHHPDAERGRYRDAGGHDDRRRDESGRCLRLRAGQRDDLRVRRARQAGVRRRGGARGQAPRRDLADRRRLPGNPADRAGRRQPAHRERRHRLGVRGQRRLLSRSHHRPAHAAPGRPAARPGRLPGSRHGPGSGPVPARPPRAAVDDLPGRDARHVRPELPGRAHRDGQVHLRRRRQHLRAVQHRARARVGGRRGAGRGRLPAPDYDDRGRSGRIRHRAGGRDRHSPRPAPGPGL